MRQEWRKIRGPGKVSLAFDDLTFWEAEEMLRAYQTLLSIRPDPKKLKKPAPRRDA